MKAGTVAVFPLALVEAVIRVRGKGFDHILADRFGYLRAKRMTPSVRCATRDLSFVHCGRHPLVAWVGYQYSNRFPVGRGCYINTLGEHVYPG